MAVRIPVYERHVQLDSGAQTIPRFSASTELGKAVKEAGGAMISVAAHWRAKQDSFDKMQMAANVGTYHAEIQQIIAEETAKFNPAVDRPGVLHDRIMERVAVANQKFQSTAPPSLASEYKIKGDASQSQTSYTSAGHESTIRNSYGRSFLDKQVADIAASVVKNPDAHPTAIAQVKQAIKDAAPASGLSPSQQRALEDTYLDTVGKNVIKGYMATGRADDAAKFREQFVKDREAESPVQFQAPTVVKPQTQLPGGATGPVEGKLNEKRIAEIDKNPTVKAAIEKAAADNGLDPQALKVFASIESSGNPKDVTGSHHGLFNLTKAEFGMNGGGNIYDAADNANAAAKVLAQKKDQLTQQLGREPTSAELYGSHNQGMGGVMAHIQNPDQPAWKTMLATKEGQDRIESDGQAGAEKWAKSTVNANVPSDVTKRLYNGDASQITSRDFMAINATKVQGGNIDEAITNARMEPKPEAPRTVVASADGTVQSDTRPPAYVGAVNVGGAQPARTLAGYQQQASIPLDEAGAHGYERGGVKTAPWLVDTVRNASKVLPEGYTAKIISTVDPRSTGTPWHPSGRAIDIQIYDDKGNKVPNVGPPSVPGWDVYEKMGAAARAYQQEKYPDQHLTWGGHFNTGTPYDRMHFQVGGDHARDFTPQQVTQAGEALKASPIQIAQADDGSGRPTVPSGLSRWQQWNQTQTNVINGGTMKAAAINAAMKASLVRTINSDLNATKVNGDGIKLTPDLQKYYGTDSLSFDFISNKIGTGAAIKWQQDKDFNQKVFNGGAHMEEMPRDVMIERLQALQPDPNSPVYDDQVKVYSEVLKKAQGIDKLRNSDPAAAADKDPVVAEARKAAYADRGNQEKMDKLITARMNAQEHLGIADPLRTPLTNDEAKELAAPLLNRARPDPANAAQEVAVEVMKRVGSATANGVPDLQQRALQTVLKTQHITQQQAADTAAALATAQHPTPAPLIAKDRQPPIIYDEFGVAGYRSKDGYFMVGKPDGTSSGPSDDYADPPSFGFAPGTRFIPGQHINELLNHKGKETEQEASDLFDSHYDSGAAKYFLSGGTNAPPTPLPPGKDVLNSEAEQTLPPAALPQEQLPGVQEDPYKTSPDDDESSGAL
jgi:Transglycosylase SLT domain